MLPKKAGPGGPKILRTKRRLRVRFGEAATEKIGYSRNVSETGIHIETNQSPAPDTGLLLEIDTPEQVFEMWGLVVWSRRFPPRFAHVMRGGMGCRFLDPSDEWLAFYRQWKRES